MFNVKLFDSEAFCGYKQITTFYMDFGIAEPFGVRAIRDTYTRGLEYAKTDYKVLTELVMVLNWKIWEHYQTNEKLARVYNDLWEQANIFAIEYLKGDELRYFYRTTD